MAHACSARPPHAPKGVCVAEDETRPTGPAGLRQHSLWRGAAPVQVQSPVGPHRQPSRCRASCILWRRALSVVGIRTAVRGGVVPPVWPWAGSPRPQGRRVPQAPVRPGGPPSDNKGSGIRAARARQRCGSSTNTGRTFGGPKDRGGVRKGSRLGTPCTHTERMATTRPEASTGMAVPAARARKGSRPSTMLPSTYAVAPWAPPRKGVAGPPAGSMPVDANPLGALTGGPCVAPAVVRTSSAGSTPQRGLTDGSQEGSRRQAARASRSAPAQTIAAPGPIAMRG